jgi:hypothetical protein
MWHVFSFLSFYSNPLEELTVRANVALNQKKVLQDLAADNDVSEDAFEKEIATMSAQVVSESVRWHDVRLCAC